VIVEFTNPIDNCVDVSVTQRVDTARLFAILAGIVCGFTIFIHISQNKMFAVDDRSCVVGLMSVDESGSGFLALWIVLGVLLVKVLESIQRHFV
jgi:hypothetical protein